MSVVAFALFFCAGYSQALETDFHGRLQSTTVLRDINGFQWGFLDDTKVVQCRNELKFDLTVRPEYEHRPNLRMEKIFLSYRGAYDAIFDLTDRYDPIREKSPSDFMLGRDDLEYENDLREAFVDLVVEGADQKLVFRGGRQIVQWGEADGFNVVNIVNPLDNSTMMFFENPEELATPLWMGRFNYSRDTLGPFYDIGIEVLAVPDIRPQLLGPLEHYDDEWPGFVTGDGCPPYSFWAQHNKRRQYRLFGDLLKKYFSPAFDADAYSLDFFEQFGHDTGLPLPKDPPTNWIEDVPSSTFDNMEYGVRLQAAYGSFLGNLYYFHGHQDFPAVDWSPLVADGTAFLTHPEQDMYGASFNFFLSSINAVLRGEGCMMNKMHLLSIEGVTGFPDGLAQGAIINQPPFVVMPLIDIPPSTTGIKKHVVYYALIGIDKDLWIRWLNPNDMIGTSWQAYHRHISGWDDNLIDLYNLFYEDDNYRLTGFLYTDYWHGRIHPEIFFMYDPEGVWMTSASVKYSRDGKLFFKLSQISFWGNSGNQGGDMIGGAYTDFTQPADLTIVSELSFRVGYNW